MKEVWEYVVVESKIKTIMFLIVAAIILIININSVRKDKEE